MENMQALISDKENLIGQSKVGTLGEKVGHLARSLEFFL